MNKEVIMQIVRDLEKISDQQLIFGSAYKTVKSTSKRFGKSKEVFGPLGNHIRQHPELKKLLDVKLRFDEYPYAPTISEMLNTNAKSFTIKREWWSINSAKLEEYLGLGHRHVNCLFYNSGFTREEFVDTVTAFVNGELDILECQGEGCGAIYTTSPDTKGCVCDSCYDYMMDMCGELED